MYAIQTPAPKGPSIDEQKAWVKSLKEERVNLYRLKPNLLPKDGPEMEGHLAFFRGGELIALLRTANVDKHEALEALQAGWVGFGADQAWMIVDAHMQVMKANTPEERASVEEYLDRMRPGEMQRMCDEEGACEVNKISDCMMLHNISPDHQIVFSMPYKYGPKKKTLEWSEDMPISDSSDSATGAKGLLPDFTNKVRKIKATKLPESMRHSMDHMAVKALENLGCVVDLRTCSETEALAIGA